MKYVTFLQSSIIHAADDALRPLCGQTDADKQKRVQNVIASSCTCDRCSLLLEVRDKNSPAARTRRRFAAARQALRDARTGVEQFEKRTTDPAARKQMAIYLTSVMRDLVGMAEVLQHDEHRDAGKSEAPNLNPKKA